MRLKQFGAFRSGSNYVKTLLELNYDVEVVAGYGGFKHAPYPAIFGPRHCRPVEPPVVVTVKSPLPWLDSLWRYANDVGREHVTGGKSWRRFLREPFFITHGREPSCPSFRFADPIDYYNALYHNLLSLPEEARVVVRYEDLLDEPESTVTRLAEGLGLLRVSEEFADVDRRVMNMADRPRTDIEEYVEDEPFDPGWYQEQRWRQRFSWWDRRWVRKRLAADVVKRLGYRH